MNIKEKLVVGLMALFLGPLLYLLFSFGGSSQKTVEFYSLGSGSSELRIPARVKTKLPKRFCTKQKQRSASHTPEGDFTVQPVYVYPKGSSRFKRDRNIILHDMRFADRFMTYATQGKRQFAWKLQGVCGDRYPDLVTVGLRFSPRYYKSLNKRQLWHQLRKELRAVTVEKRNLLIYAANVRKSSYTMPGFGELSQDSDPGPTNLNAVESNHAYILGDGSRRFAKYADPKLRAQVTIHELLHTLGAVQNDAPHASGGGHCLDVADIVCYQDGRKRTYRRCKGQVRLDCGRDTYFSLNPKKGSWLDRNWNTADSPYLIGSRYRPGS